MRHCKRIICVRARKRSDTILESRNRYYHCENLGIVQDSGWHFYVLEQVVSPGLSHRLFRVVKVLSFRWLMATCIVLTFLKTGKILHAAGVMISSAFQDRDDFKSPISNPKCKKWTRKKYLSSLTACLGKEILHKCRPMSRKGVRLATIRSI